MRSSVSVILSSPPPDTTMSYPDYLQTSQDHQSLLILVRHIGQQLKQKTFNKVFERISRLQHVRVQDTQGAVRGVWVRYVKSYPVENNDWGDFQTHRRVLGLICIGTCSKQPELNELCRIHESLRVKYSSTLYDSRCILFGLHQDGVPYEPNLRQEESDHGLATSENDAGGCTDATSPLGSHANCNSVDSFPKKGSCSSMDRDSGVFDQNAVGAEGNLQSGVREGTEVGTKSVRLDESTGLSTVQTESKETEDGDTTIQNDGTSDSLNNYMGSSSSNSSDGSISSPCSENNAAGDSPQSSVYSTSNSPSQSPSSGTSPEGNSGPDTPDSHGQEIVSSPSIKSSSSNKSITSNKSSLGPTKSYTTPSNFKTRALFYPTPDMCDSLESDLQEFISSLFWVLESKRLDKSHEKQDRVPLVCAPFEKKDFVGLDMDSRTNRKRCVGRMKKQLGDLSLQLGLPGEAINYYFSAVDILKSVNDWLWLAGAFEGLCAASVVTLYPNMRRSQTLHRNSSFQGGSPIKQRKSSIATHSLPNGLDPVDMKQATRHCLSKDEIIEKYREAIVHYSKYRNAGIIETEASIKATHVLIEQQHSLMAAEFLQNIVFINLQLNDEEKIQRFMALSDLYGKIGFHRKAAFFRRVAAMRCVAQQNPQPNWSLCYSLLLQTLEGYKLSLDPATFPRSSYGWPALQIQILHELVGTSRRMGNNALGTRHMTFLLHAMFDHLTDSERREFSQQLELMTSKCEGLSVPLALDSGMIIPPVNFINLPRIKTFKLQNLAPHLCPQRLTSGKTDEYSGPFLYTPLQFGSLTRNKKNKQSTKMDFKWLEGDVCEVSMQVINPLPFELKVMNMSLLTDSIAFETFPSSFLLPAESGPYPINLLGSPKATGELHILGYSTYVMGVKSNCRFKNLPAIKKPNFSIEVVPALPQIQVSTSLPKSASFSSLGDTSQVVTSASLSMYTGESQECTVTLTNCGQEPVEFVEISLESRLEQDVEKEFFSFSQENLQAQLPIQKGNSASFTLYIYAAGDFLSSKFEDSVETGSNISGSQPTSLTSGPSSLPSHLSNVPSSTKSKTKRTESTTSLSSVRSGSSARSGSSTGSSRYIKIPEVATHYPPKVIEGLLRVKYSGGPGMKADYCRMCSVAVCVEVLPSLQITKWDVLPAETPTHCYLVLDVLNMTSHEMELQYTTNKRILIEEGDICRIPVPIERCPLNKLSKVYHKPCSMNSEDLEEIERVCSDHVSGLVDLRWLLGASETSGKASVHGITWNPVMLDLVRMSPIQWEVSLNGEPYKPQSEVVCSVGEFVTVGITIHNHLEMKLNNFLLRVLCCQDHQNGYSNYRLETKLSLVGSDKVMIPQIKEQQSYHHKCSVIFFTPGQYKLDIQCSSGTKDTQSKYENVAVPGGHSWKYTPPIEITIADA